MSVAGTPVLADARRLRALTGEVLPGPPAAAAASTAPAGGASQPPKTACASQVHRHDLPCQLWDQLSTRPERARPRTGPVSGPFLSRSQAYGQGEVLLREGHRA